MDRRGGGERTVIILEKNKQRNTVATNQSRTGVVAFHAVEWSQAIFKKRKTIELFQRENVHNHLTLKGSTLRWE